MKDFVYYDESSPTLLRWSIDTYRRKSKDKPAGCLQANPAIYHLVRIHGVLYRIHQVVWELHNGPIPEGYVIDHIDQNKHNNLISNLRCVSIAVNNYNSDKRKGVEQRPNGRWRARIKVSGVLKTIGTFDTEQEARAAYHTTKEAYTL